MNQNQMNQFGMQIQFLQNQINQLQNQMNQPVGNPMNQMQLNYLQMQVNNLQNQLNQLEVQQMNQMNNFNQMNQINNFNQMNQINNIMPMEFAPFGIPQNGFAPFIQPSENNDYKVLFKTTNGKIYVCFISKDSSIQNMFQIFGTKVSKEMDIKDYAFLYNAKKLDINSQMKVTELFSTHLNPIIQAFEVNPSVKLTFKTSSGITNYIKYYGCVCCSSFWTLLQVYLREIGLEESCLKDLQFIFKGKVLPKDKKEASKYPSAKYGINAYETILVIDEKNLVGEKMKNKNKN